MSDDFLITELNALNSLRVKTNEHLSRIYEIEAILDSRTS